MALEQDSRGEIGALRKVKVKKLSLLAELGTILVDSI